jgi:chromosome segregation ATPase
LRQVADEYA